MLRDSKSTVSVIALLASLFSYPVCAQPAAGGQGTQEGSVESVTVTGSRVISDIANSHAADWSAEQLLATPSTSRTLEQAADFQNSSSRVTWQRRRQPNGDFLNLRNFGPQRTLVLLDGMACSRGQNGGIDVSTCRRADEP
jgi:hypothetical protein